MVLDPTSGIIPSNRAEQQVTTDVANEPSRAQEERPETGQTSEAAPAVVANLSAAALETTRPVNEAEQAADQERANEPVTNADRGQNRAAEEAAREGRRSRVDLVV